MKRSSLMAVFVLSFFIHDSLSGQNLTLADCQSKARQNYPLIRQKDLILRSKEYSISNVRTGNLPQVSINGQSTYQSDVTKVPIDFPGLSIKPLAKDQYKIYGEVNQNVYDGGTVKKATELQALSAQLEDQRVEVDLYSIRERVNQIFFSIILLKEQLELNELLRKDLQTSLAKAEASIQNGTSLKMNGQILMAELLKVKQRDIESKSAKKAYQEVLGMFINESISDQTQLVSDNTAASIPDLSDVSTPELKLFQYQRRQINQQYQLSNTASVNTQQDVFLLNTRMLMRQQSAEITKLEELIMVDTEIIDLRNKIKGAAQAQLDNGVISANDFLKELNAEDQAKQNKLLHEIQLRLARVNLTTTVGKNESN